MNPKYLGHGTDYGFAPPGSNINEFKHDESGITTNFSARVCSITVDPSLMYRSIYHAVEVNAGSSSAAMWPGVVRGYLNGLLVLTLPAGVALGAGQDARIKSQTNVFVNSDSNGGVLDDSILYWVGQDNIPGYINPAILHPKKFYGALDLIVVEAAFTPISLQSVNIYLACHSRFNQH